MVSVARLYKKLLPHISRIFSAHDPSSSFRYVALASFLAFVFLNIWMQHSLPVNFVLERYTLLSSPFSRTSHITFATSLHASGLSEEAKQELSLAQSSSIHPLFSHAAPSVLGAESETTDLLHTWDMEASYTNRAYQYWKSISEEHPDYRDSYIHLALYAVQLHKVDEATTAFSKAHTLDPNNADIQTLAAGVGINLN